VIFCGEFITKPFPHISATNISSDNLRKFLNKFFVRYGKALQQTFTQNYCGKFISKPFPQISPTNISSDMERLPN
jgi:hypothetical protein